MLANDKHIRHLMLYVFRKNIYATKATKNICEVYPNGASVHTVRRWFVGIRSGYFSFEDKRGRGRLTDLGINALETLVESDPRPDGHQIETSHTPIE